MTAAPGELGQPLNRCHRSSAALRPSSPVSPRAVVPRSSSPDHQLLVDAASVHTARRLLDALIAAVAIDPFDPDVRAELRRHLGAPMNAAATALTRLQTGLRSTETRETT